MRALPDPGVLLHLPLQGNNPPPPQSLKHNPAEKPLPPILIPLLLNVLTIKPILVPIPHPPHDNSRLFTLPM